MACIVKQRVGMGIGYKESPGQGTGGSTCGARSSMR